MEGSLNRGGAVEEGRRFEVGGDSLRPWMNRMRARGALLAGSRRSAMPRQGSRQPASPGVVLDGDPRDEGTRGRWWWGEAPLWSGPSPWLPARSRDDVTGGGGGVWLRGGRGPSPWSEARSRQVVVGWAVAVVGVVPVVAG